MVGTARVISAIVGTPISTHRLILAIACGVAMLYLIIGAWQDIAFVSSGERLLRVGLMIGFAFAGTEWGMQRCHSSFPVRGNVSRNELSLSLPAAL